MRGTKPLLSLVRYPTHLRGSFEDEFHGKFVPWAQQFENENRSFNPLSDVVVVRIKTATSVLLARLMEEHSWDNPTLAWLPLSKHFSSTFTGHPAFLRKIQNAPTTIYQTMISLRYMLEYCVDAYNGDSELMVKMSNVVRNCGGNASIHKELKSLDERAELPFTFGQFRQRTSTLIERINRAPATAPHAHVLGVAAFGVAGVAVRGLDTRELVYGGCVLGDNLPVTENNTPMLKRNADQHYQLLGWSKKHAISAPLPHNLTPLLESITKDMALGDPLFANDRGVAMNAASWCHWFHRFSVQNYGAKIGPKQVRQMCATAINVDDVSPTVRTSLGKLMGVSPRVTNSTYSQRPLSQQTALGALWQSYANDDRFDPSVQNVTVPAFSPLGGVNWVPARLMRTDEERVTLALFEEVLTESKEASSWLLGTTTYVLESSTRGVAWDRANAHFTTDPNTGRHSWRNKLECVEDATRAFDMCDAELLQWARNTLMAAHSVPDPMQPGDFVYLRGRGTIGRIDRVDGESVACHGATELARELAVLTRIEGVAYECQHTELANVLTTRRNLLWPIDVSFSKRSAQFVLRKSRALSVL
jgi:hypothetical protein